MRQSRSAYTTVFGFAFVVGTLNLTLHVGETLR